MENLYLNFGGPGTVDGPTGPRQTICVPHRVTDAPRSGQTLSGYGHAIPTRYLVRWGGRWRRVYACQYGNASTAFIGTRCKRDQWLATVDVY